MCSCSSHGAPEAAADDEEDAVADVPVHLFLRFDLCLRFDPVAEEGAVTVAAAASLLSSESSSASSSSIVSEREGTREDAATAAESFASC